MKGWYQNYKESQEERIEKDLQVLFQNTDFRYLVKGDLFFKKLSTGHLKNGDVLEIGAVPYIMTEKFYERTGRKVDVMDKDTKRIKPESDCVSLYLNGDIETPDFKIGKDYRLILFTEVFEHLSNPLTAIDNIELNLKRNGLVLLTTPNLYKLENFFSFNTGRGFKFGSREEWEKEKELGHRGHVREYSGKELKDFFQNFWVVDERLVTFRSKNNIIGYLIKKSIPIFREHRIMVLGK